MTALAPDVPQRNGTRTGFGSGPRLAVGLFFAGLVLVGVATFRDFGVTWDEPGYYEYGQLTKDFYEDGDRAYETFLNLRFYGPAVPLLHAVVADWVDPDPVDLVPLAHLVNYLLFVGGVFAFYCLVRRQTGSRGWGIVGALALVLSPRIFSHAFVNPKDVPFLALMVVGMAILVRYRDTGERWLLVPLGVASGVLIDIRVVGLVMVGLVLATLAVDAALVRRPPSPLAAVAPAWIFLATTIPVVLLGWPWLWADPIGRFEGAMAQMSEFPVGTENVMAYQGEITSVVSPPWHYFPVWIGITTPVPYLLLALVGVAVALRRRPLATLRGGGSERHEPLYLLWLLGPPLVPIALDSAVYDEWRHISFIYPALLMFSVLGARALWSSLAGGRARVVVQAAGAVGVLWLVWTGVSMWRLHPYEAVYFNELVGGPGGASGRYEMDYWGLSYREGLAHLLSRQDGARVDVFVCTPPGQHNASLFRGSDRLRFTEALSDADFALCTPKGAEVIRGGGEDYLPDHPTLMTVRRSGATLLFVKDLRDGET